MQTVAEYAKSVGKSRFTIYRWIKTGKIKNVIVFCGRMLIPYTYEIGDKNKRGASELHEGEQGV